jgi:transposase
MTRYKEILRLYHHLGIKKLQIAESLGCSRTTVISVLAAAAKASVGWEDVKELSDREVKQILFPSSDVVLPQYRMPDWDCIHKEMGRTGVTLSLLWVEYCEECRNSGQIPYQSTQFYKYYREYTQKHRATMHINRKPGDIMEVDWAGDAAHITDSVTGEVIKAYIFVAVLAYSKYAYVEAFFSQNEAAWIAAHNGAYRYFGGVARITVPDNLKTGVISNTKDKTVINRTYQEMAEHYDTAILPARPYRPKDKPNAEGEVGVVSTWIIAALRNRTFFSLAELNVAIMEKLPEYNERPFQKKDGSRYSMYLEEKVLLKPLPKFPFEIAFWKTAKLQDNYHVASGGKYYSAPYEFIGKELDLRIAEGTIEIFCAGTRIASHPLLPPHGGKYSTREEHMPPEHRAYGEWNADRFCSWADKFGPNARAVVDYFFSNVKVEQQAYKACRALLHLADKYSAIRLEAACEKAISFSPYPSLRSIQAVLKSGRDRLPDSEDKEPEQSEASLYGFVRGADYYKGGDN